MIKVIAIDMDGTLLDSQKAIPEANKKALQAAQAAGLDVVLCTGRALSGVKPLYGELGLAQEGYAILNNGCSTHRTSDWQLVADRHLTAEELTALYDLLADHPQVQLTVFDEDNYFVVADEALPIIHYDAGLVFTTPTCVTLEELLSREVVYFQAMFVGEPADVDAFQAQHEADLARVFSVVRSQSYIFEILPAGTNKASALSELVDQLGYSPEEVMAIGDANNDLEMLAYAGYSVAMGNSPDHIKAVAKYQTASNDEAGVAQAIERWALPEA